MKKRVREGEIVVVKTDKSGKLSAMDRDTYIDAGREHTSKDEENTREECERRQKILNGHQSSWLKILNNGEDWSHQDRFRSTTINNSAAVLPLYILVKDHKPPRPDGIPKTRPVVSGNQGMTVHLNNTLSDLIEPIVALAEDSAEVISTEDSLRKIDDANERLKNTHSEMKNDEKYKPVSLCSCSKNSRKKLKVRE